MKSIFFDQKFRNGATFVVLYLLYNYLILKMYTTKCSRGYSVTNFKTMLVYFWEITLALLFWVQMKWTKKPLLFQVYSLPYFIGSIYIMRTRLKSNCFQNGLLRILMDERRLFLCFTCLPRIYVLCYVKLLRQ